MSDGTVYATNNDGTGLFVRRSGQGGYHQIRGNGQFSARTVEALRRGQLAALEWWVASCWQVYSDDAKWEARVGELVGGE